MNVVEFHIEEIFGREISNLNDKQRKHILNKALEYWRTKGFPYPECSGRDVISEFQRIKSLDTDKIFNGGVITTSSVGLKLANSFHPQMWHIKCQGHNESPIDHFNNDATLLKLLERAITFWPDRKCWRAYNLRNLLRIYSGGRVANFRPSAAKAVINTYSKDGDRVLDFCAGFGGRLLGSLSLKRHYVGVDVSSKTILGLKNLYANLKTHSIGTAEIVQESAENYLMKQCSNEFDLIFTSPPYFDLEKYSNESQQSFIKYRTYDEWRQKFLGTVISESYRLLSEGGYFIINVSDYKKYLLVKDVKQNALKYFQNFKMLQLAMNSRPLQRSNGHSYRYEPILIFRK